MTDGFWACFVFARCKPKKETDPNVFDLEDFQADEVKEHFLPYPNVFDLEDFQADEVKEHFLPCALDPGRRQIFTATVAHSPEELEIRRCSGKERACYAGTNRRATYVERLKTQQNVKTIETNLPTAKTVNNEKFQERIRYLLVHLPRLFQFYSYKSAPFRFNDYQGRQRANAEMANILINGGKKYNKMKRKNTIKNRKQRKKKHKDKKITKDKGFVQL
ncbi:hypothetical protein INT46_002206 [Mucor plumbeus]|uniref:Uncharacterized protein n=1 Tax=Mucor plumbeus TaxID=97098 RepID=A0A8H7URQ2_9FUNG|nr:hypothetical protein INT46_002206 [Mucor plumbeus]